ncbi:type I restriction enzyme, S subunit [Candidatus Electrothrix aarhusensis]|uniref:Type I restriction enzyme, S subunit n=1 Tax=Candidatus Electrothrix aarhusensis TaxID=1859131 RepID=A0A3S3UBN7_9BACT|nr:type I restriction enzyme, S subunit [Candidatus Electrothrix aarhusensis]
MQRFERYSGYKDSGVDWIGEIPAGWEVKRLGFIANCFPSNIDKHSKKNEKTVRLCNYTDVYKNDFITDDQELMLATASVEQIEKFSLMVGDVIITKDSETANDIAVPAYVKETLTNVVCGYHLAMIRPYTGLYGKYLFRAFQSKIFNAQFAICSNGITRVGLGNHDLKHGLFLTPPLQEQTAIANFLDEKTTKIDTAIAQKEQMISLLKERKQILIQKAVTKGVNPDAKMKDSGVEWIGEIPKHWEMKRGKFLFTEVDERSVDGQEELLSVSHMTGVTPRSEKKVSMFMAEDYTGSKTCIAGDLIYNIMWAWMGALGVANQAGIVSPSYGVYRRKDNHTLNTKFIELLLKSTQYVAYYNKVSTGLHSSRLRFYSHMFFNMEIVFPSLAEQEDIIQHIETETAKIENSIILQQQQITKLKEYKSILIDHAVTGKIKVA